MGSQGAEAGGDWLFAAPTGASDAAGEAGAAGTDDGEVAASMAGFHPRQLKDMPRVEMQHLMVKINRPAKVGNDDLRRALTDWWEKRQAKGRPVSSG